MASTCKFWLLGFLELSFLKKGPLCVCCLHLGPLCHRQARD